MGATIPLQNTVNWEKSFIEQQPVLVNGMEPVLSSANLILQTILGPPFAWPWNRAALSFATVAQDFSAVGLTDFGFLEGGTAQAPGGASWEISVKNVLQRETNLARPTYCSALIDDGLGNITFRLSPKPNGSHTIDLLYQKKAVAMQSLASLWGPIPDEKNYICQWGHLALMSLIGNDARFGEYNTKFIVSLLGAQGGLTEMERNIFLANWTRVLSQLQANQLGTAERFKARES
jgi:hypothetical protein